MEKLDLTKTDRRYYHASSKPEIVELPAIPYLSIEGKGDPSSTSFSDKIQTIYPVAYAIKFIYKSRKRDFAVSKLEGQWWFDESLGKPSITEAPLKIPRDAWQWRLLIRLPDYVEDNVVKEAIESTSVKKNLPHINEVSFITLEKRKVVQMLHKGPFDTEPDTLLVMDEFMKRHNFKQAGLHHEIYLSDFRKTAPDKLKTILREPVTL